MPLIDDKKPKIPEIGEEHLNFFVKGLILAMLSTGADKMTKTEYGFAKDGYNFGDFEVKVTKLK
jgi:hypothetical protein